MNVKHVVAHGNRVKHGVGFKKTSVVGKNVTAVVFLVYESCVYTLKKRLEQIVEWLWIAHFAKGFPVVYDSERRVRG